jgi:hypothetical protein
MFNADRLFLNKMSMELPPSMSTLSKLHFIDTGTKDESKMTWFGDGGPLIRPAEVDFSV